MKTIVPVGIGLILSISLAFWQYKSKSVARWMKQRRIDNSKGWTDEKRTCPTCGKPMIAGFTKREKVKMWFCKDWKNCKTYIEHHTGKRLSPGDVERSG